MNPILDVKSVVELSDAELVKNVRLLLIASRNGFRGISIEADRGVVRLSGPIRSYFLRQTAVVMTKRMAGVRQVIDIGS